MSARSVHVTVTRDAPLSYDAPSGRPFVELALAIARSPTAGDLRRTLQASSYVEIRNLIEKADALSLASGDWGGTDAGILADAFVHSIADGDLLSQLVAQGARVLPRALKQALIGTATASGPVDQAAPKLVIEPTADLADAPETKSAAIAVVSTELAELAGVAVFERELRSAILSATNTAVLVALGTTPVTATADSVADLMAGLAAAPASEGYVVVGGHGQIAGIESSGDFRPSGRVSLVPVDGVAGLHIIPAGRVALSDTGLVARSAKHATLDMAGGESPAFSLWQRNCIGILVERSFRVAVQESS